MKTFKQTTPPIFKKETYEELEYRITTTYENIERIGETSDGERSVYGIGHGDYSRKPVIFLTACIHGDEWESTYWTLHFLDCVINPYKSIPEMRNFFRTVRIRYSFYVIPVVSPLAFDNETRNTLGVNLNREFDNDNYPEVAAVKKSVLEKKPVLFVDNHTAKTSKETIGVGGRGRVDLRFLIDNIIETMKYVRGHNLVDWYPVDPVQNKLHIGRGWASNQESIYGVNTISILIEGLNLPKHELNNYRDKTEYGFNTLLATCLFLDDYFTKGIISE